VDEVNRQGERIGAVKTSDIKAEAQRMLSPQRANVLYYKAQK
jgi:hypothetical protein